MEITGSVSNSITGVCYNDDVMNMDVSDKVLNR